MLVKSDGNRPKQRRASIFFKDFIYFLGREEEREKERERNIDWLPPAHILTWVAGPQPRHVP